MSSLITKCLISVITLGACLLMACSRQEDTKQPAGVIPQHQLETLEKAKQTEDLLKEKDEQRRKQLEGL